MGRRRIIEDILSENAPLRKTAERQAVNTVCQGSSADLIKVHTTGSWILDSRKLIIDSWTLEIRFLYLSVHLFIVLPVLCMFPVFNKNPYIQFLLPLYLPIAILSRNSSLLPFIFSHFSFSPLPSLFSSPFSFLLPRASSTPLLSPQHLTLLLIAFCLLPQYGCHHAVSIRYMCPSFHCLLVQRNNHHF